MIEKKIKKESIKKNYIYNTIYQLLSIILPIITTPYIARTLGAEGNGIYSYTISIVTYFILFGSLGLGTYGRREIAFVQDNIEARGKIFIELMLLKSITMFISFLLFFFVFCLNGDYAIYYRILCLEILANCLDISWFYQGLENFKKIVTRNLVIKTISIISIFLFIKSPSDIDKYLIIYVLSTLFGSITLWLDIKSYIKIPKKINLIKHIPATLALFIPQIAIQIYTVLDKTMIGFLTNSMAEVGYYEQAEKVIKILLTVVTALSTVMIPRIANCFVKKEFEQINYYMKKTFNFIFFFAIPLTCGIIAVSENFVPIFFGTGYHKITILMPILSFIIIFISISTTIGGQYLLSTKREKEYTISVIAGSVVNFILNIFLIMNFQSIGAAIATVVAEFIVAYIQFNFVKKDINIKEILLLSKKYLLSSIIMLIFCMLIGKIIPNHFVSLFVQIGMGVLIYFLLLFIMKDEFLFEMLNKIKVKIKR